jgi:hypothetical protein
VRAYIAKEESVSAEEEQSGEMIEVEDIGSVAPSMNLNFIAFSFV